MARTVGGAEGRRRPLAGPPRTEIAVNRALQFHCGGGPPYHCTAGDTLVAVMPNGDLYPCRRMPIRAGNLLETPLTQLYDCEPVRCAEGPHACGRRAASAVSMPTCAAAGCAAWHTLPRATRSAADPGCWLASPYTAGMD